MRVLRFLARLLGLAAVAVIVLQVFFALRNPSARAGVPRRTIDGNKGDWLAGLPTVGNTAVLVSDGTDTEWVWLDKVGDARADFEPAESRSNWDIKVIRVIADVDYLYYLVEVDQFTPGLGQFVFQFNIAMDTEIAFNASGGNSGMNWFGDDSISPGSSTGLGNPAQYSELNIITDLDGNYIYDYNAGTWRFAANSSVAFNEAQNFVEVALKWSDLGFTSVPPRIRLTMATAKRAGGDPNAVDKTVDLGGTDFLDAVTFDAYNPTSAWDDALSTNTVSDYLDVAFDATGNVIDPNTPAAPSHLRAADAAFAAPAASGETTFTNNPILVWDPVAPDGDAGDTIAGYYVQICTSPVVGPNGFLQTDYGIVVQRNDLGAGPANQIVYHNLPPSQPWWGAADSSTGIPNSDGAGRPILQPGTTYYLRVWARDRRGILGDPSPVYVLPIDYPAWHDPYVFGINGSTFRANRDPAEGAYVNFMVGVFDPQPDDPMDNYYVNPGTGQVAPNEILNIILHIRVADPTHPTYDWATGAGRVILGDEWKDANGNIAWYLPSVVNPNLGVKDPPDSYSVFRTGGSIDFTKTWLYKYNSVNLGNNGGAEVFKLNAKAGDIVEYFFEINNPFEAPGGNYLFSQRERRFLFAYDSSGITGYRWGTYDEAKANPFRFVVQKRDLPAVWHNPVSKEVPLGAGGTNRTMRDPTWPDTFPQNVTLYVGAVGAGTLDWRLVWRNVDAGGWKEDVFNGPTVLVDTANFKYYYTHNFNYTGGMIEYYFRTSDNAVYIFANGITDNAQIVYDDSLGDTGQDTVPFRFPFTRRAKVTSTGSTGKDSHSIVAVLGLRAPQFDALDENAIGVNSLLDFSSGTATVTGSVLTNVFPGVYLGRNDTGGAPEMRRLFNRSFPAVITASGAVNGLRKAFFGPIFPFDYAVDDTSAWNTGSDAYENIPILSSDVFTDVVDREEPAGTVFGAGKPIDAVIYVNGDASISTINITRGALITEGKITISPAAIVTAQRLDLYSLGGPLTVSGSLSIETGVLFSNDTIVVDPGATLSLSSLGSLAAQALTVGTGANLLVNHPRGVTFTGEEESVLSEATRWVISSLREERKVP
ncbi:MAG: hypothetical protein D6679_10030 [Candidatus Hydrogenedentota bacterium]|nr:MAG: hypothetical protein D6679_10030 [Candidatus Hydrogenedentota bacterium]